MKLENKWLDSEISCLKYEKKRKNKRKSTDNILVFKLILMVSAVFFCVPSIEARCSVKSYAKNHSYAEDEGRQFTCSKCRACQWQAKKNADWAGNFHCTACGHNLGK